MEKIGLCKCDGKPIIGRVEYEEAVLKVNEIIEWIKEHEKYVEPLEKAWKEAVEETLKEAKAKKKEGPKATIAGRPGVLRYELSHDGVGLVAHLADEISYHIYSDKMTPGELLIRDQLLVDREG